MTPGELHEALTRWAQAEWTRLSPVGDPNRDIPRLLRDHLTNPIGPGDDGEILPGDTRIVSRPPTPPGWPPRWVEYHGYLPHGGALVSPYRIYCPDWLSDYLDGDGTTIPETSEKTHFFGRYRYGPAWLDPLPERDEDEGYLVPEGTPWTLSTIIDASLYAGLAQLLVQSVQGAGRNLSTIVPAGWSTAPGTLGCSRSPDGIYWLTNIGPTGARAARLDIPSPAPIQIDGWVRDGEITDPQEQLLAEASALGQATLALVGEPPAPDIVDLLSGEDMEPVYADSLEPLVWGWCGRYQRRDAIDQHLSGYLICCVGSDDINGWKLKSRKCAIDIEWTDGRPEATLDIETTQIWSIAGTPDRIIVMDAWSACWVLIPPLYGEVYSSPGTIAAWYEKDGTANSVLWSGLGSGGSSTLTANGCDIGGLWFIGSDIVKPSWRTTDENQTWDAAGGWSLGSGESLDVERVTSHSGSVINISTSTGPDFQVPISLYNSDQGAGWMEYQKWNGDGGVACGDWVSSSFSGRTYSIVRVPWANDYNVGTMHTLKNAYTVDAFVKSGCVTWQQVVLSSIPGTVYLLKSMSLGSGSYNDITTSELSDYFDYEIDQHSVIDPKGRDWASTPKGAATTERTGTVGNVEATCVARIAGETAVLSESEIAELNSIISGLDKTTPCGEGLGGIASYGGLYWLPFVQSNMDGIAGPIGVAHTFIGGV